MNTGKRWMFLSAACVLLLGVLVVVCGLFFESYMVDVWWFDSLGYGWYYWQRLLYRYVVFGSVTLFFFLLFFLNFWVASRYLGNAPSREEENSSTQRYKEILRMFREGSLMVYTPLSLALAIPLALPLFERWETFLLYVFAPKTGTVDAAFGKDIGYYLFSYPIYSLLQRRIFIAFALLAVGVALLYWLEHRLLARREESLHQGAKRHLCALVLAIFSIEIWDFVLQRYELLYTSSHQPLFYGPGFIEMNIILPLILTCLVLLAAVAVSFIYALYDRRGWKIFGACCVLFVLALGLRYSDFLPSVVQKYVVKPNEISREKTYIERNIDATLAAYNLKDVEVRDFIPERVPQSLDSTDVRGVLRNTPVWDGELLDGVYNQLQQLRTYYDFPVVNVNRYTVNGLYQQVFLAARELNYEQIPARNWVNEHLTYSHGYGAVMTPAGQGGDEPMTWFLRGIPMESGYGFSVEQPGIYFGVGKYTHVIVPNEAGEIDYPGENTNEISHYSGKGGVPVHSFYRKFIFSLFFKDRNIFFTAKTNKASKILFRRNVVERVRTLAPFLVLDKDPFLVVTPKRFYWMLDAYTVSDCYPGALPAVTKNGTVNTIRNSVKIVVDAYDGKTDFYIADSKDPIIRAYSRMYPGVFKDISSMPEELAAQVRYPLELFDIQMSVYAKYHQTDPDIYYQQEDAWEFAKTYRGHEAVTIHPYYLTLDLVEPGRFDFLSLVPMSPKGRDNLRALAVAGCDRPHYGKIIVYNFPKGELVYGPSQIYALSNQDTKVSEQFTLWDQAGSQVDRGQMIILPMGKVILYIQPVYLKSSTKLKIPELKRLIMSQGQAVVMEPSLEEAYARLQEKIKTETRRVDKRFAPVAPATVIPPVDAAPETKSEPGANPAPALPESAVVSGVKPESEAKPAAGEKPDASGSGTPGGERAKDGPAK